MKIISTKEYNKLKKTQSAYLELLMKPLQGVFEKVTDDDLLRENGLLNAENERLNNIIKDIKSQLDYLETYSSKEDVFEDMKRRLDKIENIVNRS